jgi:putative endonuclease
MSRNQDLGRSGENLASEYLIKNGYIILERNWVFDKAEIDIIAQKDEEIVFVEVKTRSGDYFGFPEEAVNNSKEENILRAADAYLEEKELDNEIRFDVIAIIFKAGKPEISHIIDAF